MISHGYFIFVGLFLIALIIRFGYERLKKTGRINPKNVILFIMILLTMCILWVSWFCLCPLDPSKIPLPDVLHWTGLGIFIAGLILAFGALIQLRGVENINHLITTGFFSKIRHPMYLGFIFWIFGWAIFHDAVLSLAFGFVGIGNILYWRKLEDADLAARYGDDYREYRKNTWF
jgi:protein-S-isoprenylcysteine O-methyltransferase Ste14